MFYVSIALSAISFIIGVGRLVVMMVGGAVTPVGLIISIIALIIALMGVMFGIERKKYSVALFISVFSFGINYYAVSSLNPDVINYTINYIYNLFPFLKNMVL